MTDWLDASQEWDELDEVVIRRSKRPNEDQRDEYLMLLVEGFPHVAAAHKVGSTGSAFKSYRRYDPSFNRLSELAEKGAPSAREDQVRASLWKILYEPKHPRHWEAVRFAAEVYLAELEFKRIKRFQQKVEMEGAIAATLHISIEQLRTMPEEKLGELITTFEALEATPRLSLAE